MFRAEWRAERGDAPLGHIAIVDDQPEAQYLYPEFLLFAKLFARHGLRATVIDAAQLRYEGGVLRAGGEPVDMVYNRLTDFGLDDPSHRALREAWLAGHAVVTPHPRAHALYADKRNLALLTDETALRGLGVDAATRATLLAGIPRTRPVRAEEGAALWAARRQLFFKPAAGFGSRAAWRGDKLTRRVWAEVLAGGYVAQALVPPSARHVGCGDDAVALKLDIRNYVYPSPVPGGGYPAGVQLVTARLWQGQTTNFRTPRGGFAPVLVVSASG